MKKINFRAIEFVLIVLLGLAFAFSKEFYLAVMMLGAIQLKCIADCMTDISKAFNNANIEIE